MAIVVMRFRQVHEHRGNCVFSSGVMLGIILCLTGVVVFSKPQLDKPYLDRRCLDCSCYALTDCNYTIGCRTEDRELCGPYDITYAYWLEGGAQGSGGIKLETYRECTKGIECSEKTMQMYHQLFYKDCNGNGQIGCVDFFRTHLAGPNACMLKDVEYHSKWLKFLECYLNTADDTEAALREIRSGTTSQ